MTDSAPEQGTRERVRRRFAVPGSTYDDGQVGDARGRLRNDADVRLFLDLFDPPSETAEILEVGAGTGRFTLPVVQRGYEVTATDVNDSMLETLRSRAERAGVGHRCRARVEDVFGLSFDDEAFDYAYSLHMIPRLLSLDDQAAAIAEIGRVIRPGGRFLFNYRNSRSPYRRFFEGHTAEPAQIEHFLMAAGMQTVERRGKLISSHMLFARLPVALVRLTIALDRRLSRLSTGRAWDVFELAQKASS